MEDKSVPCVAEFGIIDNFDENKDYSQYEPEKYHCIAIQDDILDDWWARLTTMKSYFHSYNRPETALARWGVTLIPPESLDLLDDIIAWDTKPKDLKRYYEEISMLLTLIRKAKSENKFVIHFGVKPLFEHLVQVAALFFAP